MKNLIAAAILLSFSAAHAGPAPIPLETGEEQSFGESDALYYPAQGQTAIAFVPSANFGPQEWAPWAERYQAEDIGAITFSGMQNKHLRRSLQELARRGHRDLIYVGAEEGAGAILDAMARVFTTTFVRKIVIIDPQGGAAITRTADNKPVEKLFIGLDDSPSFDGVARLYLTSNEPKDLLAYSSAADVTELLNGAFSAELHEEISAFILGTK